MQILYDKLRERLLTAQFNWLTADVRLAFVSEIYHADPADETLADLPEGSILVRSATFTGKTATAGYARGLPPELKLFRSNTPVGGILLFEAGGDDSTSNLICYSNDGPAIPFVGVGFDYAVAFNNSLGGFFRA